MVDERWVNHDNEASNQAFIHRCFTDNKYFKLLGMKNTAESASSGWQNLKIFSLFAGLSYLNYFRYGVRWTYGFFFPGALGIEEALDLKQKPTCCH